MQDVYISCDYKFVIYFASMNHASSPQSLMYRTDNSHQALSLLRPGAAVNWHLRHSQTCRVGVCNFSMTSHLNPRQTMVLIC